MDSDSDSDSDLEVVPAKRPLTTRKKLVPISQSQIQDLDRKESIYLCKVDMSMKAIQNQTKPPETNTSDVEEDAGEVFSTKSRGRKQPKKSSDGKGVKKSDTESAIDLGDSDDENDADTANSGGDEQNDSVRERERSPTPPPQFGVRRPPKRAPRRTKALKNAVSALEDLNFRQRLRDVVDRVHRKDEDVVIIDETMTSPSPVKAVAVKVRSLSGLHRFSMNKKDSFTRILGQLAEAEGVNVDRFVLLKDDKTVEPYDSPESINLHIADILDLHIRKEDDLNEDSLDLEDPDVIELLIQTKDPKSKLHLPIHKDTRLEKVMRDYAKKRNLTFEKLTFYFDGELIQQTQTPSMLDMESDDCIDVVES